MPGHAPQEKEFILGDLADFFSGKNNAKEDSVGNAKAWMNDGGCLVLNDTRKDLDGDFCPKGFMTELSGKFVVSQMGACRW